MNRPGLRRLFAVALLAVLGAADPLREVTHAADEPHSRTAVRVMGRLTVVLPPPADANHVWHQVSGDPQILRPKGEPRRVEITGKDGVRTARWEMIYFGIKPGTAVVRLAAVEKGKEVDALRRDEVRDVVVEVK